MTGDATSADIASGKTAVVNGELVTGTAEMSSVKCIASNLTSSGTINIASIRDDYKNLTTNDFLLVLTNMGWNESGSSVTQYPSLYYNSDTGILSYQAGAMGWYSGEYVWNVVSIYSIK